MVVGGGGLFVNTNGWPAVSDIHIVPLPGIDEGKSVRNWIALSSNHPEDDPLFTDIVFELAPTIKPAPPIAPAL